MIRTIFSLIIGFTLGVVFSHYYEINFNFDQYLKPDKSGGTLSIEHNFRFKHRSRKFDKVLLQIAKHDGPDSQIVTYNIPQANRRYNLDVDIEELNEENDFTWVIYEGGVIHRIPGNPSYITFDSVLIFDKGNINDVRVLGQEPRLTGKKKATHSVVVHNYNSYAVKPKFLITYFSANGNAIWDTVMVANVNIPPENNQKIILQVKSKKLSRAETSIISIVE
ncbi:MAG: hypothetical protein GWP19_02890, partial [Planctomycetia bacterium]|nr:hypothetical protein [Planctomycetia bacterium]